MAELTRRQAEVAARVAQGLSNKLIAQELGLSVETVRQHIREAAERLPGPAWPRHRLTLWYFSIEEAGK
jgi:DNA-binding NarL/FixJ family response regulator